MRFSDQKLRFFLLARRHLSNFKYTLVAPFLSPQAEV
jgi:hypothetical protein